MKAHQSEHSMAKQQHIKTVVLPDSLRIASREQRNALRSRKLGTHRGQAQGKRSTQKK